MSRSQHVIKWGQFWSSLTDLWSKTRLVLKSDKHPDSCQFLVGCPCTCLNKASGIAWTLEIRFHYSVQMVKILNVYPVFPEYSIEQRIFIDISESGFWMKTNKTLSKEFFSHLFVKWFSIWTEIYCELNSYCQ